MRRAGADATRSAALYCSTPVFLYASRYARRRYLHAAQMEEEEEEEVSWRSNRSISALLPQHASPTTTMVISHVGSSPLSLPPRLRLRDSPFGVS